MFFFCFFNVQLFLIALFRSISRAGLKLQGSVTGLGENSPFLLKNKLNKNNIKQFYLG
jgi:hypothetical protein